MLLSSALRAYCGWVEARSVVAAFWTDVVLCAVAIVHIGTPCDCENCCDHRQGKQSQKEFPRRWVSNSKDNASEYEACQRHKQQASHPDENPES